MAAGAHAQASGGEPGGGIYARDEAIGARPKSRRGRGMPDMVGQDDLSQVGEAPMMGDDEMLEAPGLMGGAVASWTGEGSKDAVAGAFDADAPYSKMRGSASYAMDEAHGMRPKSRRGRGVASRAAVSGLHAADALLGGLGAPLGQHHEPLLGDDEQARILRPRPQTLNPKP